MKKLFCIELVAILGVLGILVVNNVINKNTDGNYDETQVSVNEMQTVYQNQEVTEMQVAEMVETSKEEVTEAVADDVISEDVLTEDGQADKSIEEETDKAVREDILLVNKDKRLPEDYEVTLKTMPDRVNKAAEEAYQPLCDMIAAGRKEGLYFEICSSYRSVERQQELFDEDLKALIRAGFSYQEAYEEVAKETMPPGHSEHSTGLAFDIVALGYQILDAKQETTAENKWLQEHCAEYGFILRYPKGKEEITHINYESWHFRYVGVEVAEYIMEQGITLEEYLEEV